MDLIVTIWADGNPLAASGIGKILRVPGNYMARFILLVALLGPWIVQGQTVSAGHPCPVFDATDFGQKPDLTQYGLKHITVVYAGLMWDSSDEANLPDRNRISAFARLASESTDLLVIDIEEWPVVGDPATIAESIKKYQTMIRWFKMPQPALRVGVYGMPPIRDYWDSLQEEGSPRYVAWQKENDNLAPVAHLADALFPRFIPSTKIVPVGRSMRSHRLRRRARYAGGKPVYVFLWPQYHPSDKKLANTFLPGDYWRMELETARKYADGIVIWCCSNRKRGTKRLPGWMGTSRFYERNSFKPKLTIVLLGTQQQLGRVGLRARQSKRARRPHSTSHILLTDRRRACFADPRHSQGMNNRWPCPSG